MGRARPPRPPRRPAASSSSPACAAHAYACAGNTCSKQPSSEPGFRSGGRRASGSVLATPTPPPDDDASLSLPAAAALLLAARDVGFSPRGANDARSRKSGAFAITLAPRSPPPPRAPSSNSASPTRSYVSSSSSNAAPPSFTISACISSASARTSEQQYTLAPGRAASAIARTNSGVTTRRLACFRRLHGSGKRTHRRSTRKPLATKPGRDALALHAMKWRFLPRE